MIRIPILSRMFTARRPDVLAALYGDIVATSRTPIAYTHYGVRDDFEGRFERLTLIMTLVLRRLRALPAPATEIAQELVDRFFAELDTGLRLAGISDIAVPKRIKKLAQGFYGRAEAYTAALDGGDEMALRIALSRNLFGGRIAPEDIAMGQLNEISGLNAALSTCDSDALLRGTTLSSVLSVSSPLVSDVTS